MATKAKEMKIEWQWRQALLGVVVIATLALLAPKPQSALTVWFDPAPQVVEQQGNIQNNTGCIWDVDDSWRAFGGGALPAGESFIVTRCIIADWIGHLWASKASAEKSADFRLTLSVPELGFSVSKDAVLVGRIKQAHICIDGPEYDHGSLLLEPIPSGGVGKQVTATWVITNTGTRTVRDLGGSFDVTPDFSNYQDALCPQGWPIWEHEQTSGIDPRFWWD